MCADLLLTAWGNETLTIQIMNFYKSILAGLSSLFIVGFFSACSPGQTGSADEVSSEEPYRIVCTVGMITDVVKNIAGEHATVEGIIGEGVDPHLYKPTRTDVVTLSEADIIFYNGLLLEGKMADVLVRLAGSGKPVRAVTEAILNDTDYLLEKDDG